METLDSLQRLYSSWLPDGLRSAAAPGLARPTSPTARALAAAAPHCGRERA
ncbi:MAG: hypothetical protein H8E31_02780, partial [Planctomycetes bacterium]|nr:hypothetical protein [Planctomycetota bacterium]